VTAHYGGRSVPHHRNMVWSNGARFAKALRSIYWGGGGGPALPPARGVRPACGVYKTRQDKLDSCCLLRLTHVPKLDQLACCLGAGGWDYGGRFDPRFGCVGVASSGNSDHGGLLKCDAWSEN
jgi:hypothetical protein